MKFVLLFFFPGFETVCYAVKLRFGELNQLHF